MPREVSLVAMGTLHTWHAAPHLSACVATIWSNFLCFLSAFLAGMLLFTAHSTAWMCSAT